MKLPLCTDPVGGDDEDSVGHGMGRDRLLGQARQYQIGGMADDVSPFQGQYPPDLWKDPIKTDEHPDPKSLRIKDRKPLIAGLKIVFFIHEKVALAIFPHITLRAHQHGRVIEMVIASFVKSGHNIKVRLPAFVSQVGDETALADFFRGPPGLITVREIVSGVTEFWQDHQISLF